MELSQILTRIYDRSSILPKLQRIHQTARIILSHTVAASRGNYCYDLPTGAATGAVSNNTLLHPNKLSTPIALSSSSHQIDHFWVRGIPVYSVSGPPVAAAGAAPNHGTSQRSQAHRKAVGMPGATRVTLKVTPKPNLSTTGFREAGL